MIEPSKSGADDSVLAALGAQNAPLIGEGGEASVYGLDAKRVLRVARPGATLAGMEARASLLAEIADGARHLPWATPQVEKVVVAGDRIAMIERRLPGVPFTHVLAAARGEERRNLLSRYLGVAERIGEIAISRAVFGDLLAEPPIARARYRDYLRARIARVRARSGSLAPDLSQSLADDMPDCTQGALVHFDLFPGNVLVADGRVSAVIDFGAMTMIADPRLDCWSIVAYLDPAISPNARDDDRALARAWLDSRGLMGGYRSARRWLAGCWSFAEDDTDLMAWCRSILIQPQGTDASDPAAADADGCDSV